MKTFKLLRIFVEIILVAIVIMFFSEQKKSDNIRLINTYKISYRTYYEFEVGEHQYEISVDDNSDITFSKHSMFCKCFNINTEGLLNQ